MKDNSPHEAIKHNEHYLKRGDANGIAGFIVALSVGKYTMKNTLVSVRLDMFKRCLHLIGLSNFPQFKFSFANA